MRIFVTPDLHGEKVEVYSDYDRIVCIGDYRSSPQRKYIFKALRINREEGIDINWQDLVGEKKARKLYKKGEKEGIRLLKHLKKLSKPDDLLLIPGNWDNTKEEVTFWAPNYKVNRGDIDHNSLIKKLGGIKDFHKKKVEFKNFIIIGYGISNTPELPIKHKDEYTKKEYDKIKKKYDKVLEQCAKHFRYAKKKKKPVIFFTHNVPYNTKLDVVRNKDSPGDGMHLGSYMARELVEKFQPKICLGGHMHEHYGFDKINNTLIVNVGYGKKKNTYLEIKEKDIKVELWQDKRIIKKKSVKL